MTILICTHTPDDTFDKIEPARINQADRCICCVCLDGGQCSNQFWLWSGIPEITEALRNTFTLF